MQTIGIDLGDKWSHVCVLDESGEVIEQGRVATRPEALRQRFGGLKPARVAVEAGTHSAWVERVLQECGHEVLVANSRKVRLISRNDRKCDEVDAEWLARLARLEPKLLAPIQHRQGRLRQDLAVLRSRDILVKARTRMVNHVRGVVKAFGGRLRDCTTSNFHRQAGAQLPEELHRGLTPIIDMIAALNQQIREYDKQIDRLAEEEYPETVLLRQVSGVGALTATCFVLTIGDPHRFRSSRTLGAYLGLRPRRDQSGGRDPELHIAKSGDTDLIRLLVTSAHYILGPFGPDSDLRRWGLRLASRGDKNAKKRALVAVARKLAVLLHRLWVTGLVYEPFYQSENHLRDRLPALGVS